MINLNQIDIYKGQSPLLTFTSEESGYTFGLAQKGGRFFLVDGLTEDGSIIYGVSFNSLSAAIAEIEKMENKED